MYVWRVYYGIQILGIDDWSVGIEKLLFYTIILLILMENAQ